MAIVRDEQISFHKAGTVKFLSQWVGDHDTGIAEWLKNTRRAYAGNRANVEPENRAAVLLFSDGVVVPVGDEDTSARIGLLDVGGATLDDVEAWSRWMDPDASRRGTSSTDEITQGNGGKAYMVKLFRGPAMICGVKDDIRNCKGFETRPGEDIGDRGQPGFMPDPAEGKNVRIVNWKDDLNRVLRPYHITFDDLPVEMRRALTARKAFTLVEGSQPVGHENSAVPVDDIVRKLLRRDTAARAIEEVNVFVMHNGEIQLAGKPLKLEPIPSHPDFEDPLVIAIPETLPGDGGQQVSTTEGEKYSRGRLILHTSRTNMQLSSVLNPRWVIRYRTSKQTAGTREVSALAPNTPGSAYVYGECELEALEAGYISLGRDRPGVGPLTRALDSWIGERIRERAREINDKRRIEFDEEALEEVQKENVKLNRFKNKFLPSEFNSEGSDEPDPAKGGKATRDTTLPNASFGSVPEKLDISHANETLRIGVGVNISLKSLLSPTVRDAQERPVRAEIEWSVDKPRLLEIKDDRATALAKGAVTVRARVKGTDVYSDPVTFDCWIVDYVLLTPRSMVVKVGERQLITAEVTNDEGKRDTKVLLEWEHSADDPLILRLRQTGFVTGNRVGRTVVRAGAGGKWATNGVDIEVTPNDKGPEGAKGMPQLLITGMDEDPTTGNIREGDPDSPALWQEPTDFVHNIWWINLQSPDAAFAFKQRTGTDSMPANPTAWRQYHALKIVEMVAQVHMKIEFSNKGENEQREFWSTHKNNLDAIMVRLMAQMWEPLADYVRTGKEPT